MALRRKERNNSFLFLFFFHLLYSSAYLTTEERITPYCTMMIRSRGRIEKLAGSANTSKVDMQTPMCKFIPARPTWRAEGLSTSFPNSLPSSGAWYGERFWSAHVYLEYTLLRALQRPEAPQLRRKTAIMSLCTHVDCIASCCE